MDNDKSGQEGCAKFAAKLGKHRCWIVRPRADMQVRGRGIIGCGFILTVEDRVHRSQYIVRMSLNIVFL